MLTREFDDKGEVLSGGEAQKIALSRVFASDNPVVILDDPFVNLDDEHTEQALKLLKELSQNRQILYLTCSSSRTPN